MVVKDKNIEKLCSFYVSDFHLEMILVPYIIKKLENNENVEIITEKNLEETIKILISKMNLNQENKQKILKLNWNKKDINQFENEVNIIIIGTEEFIEEKNKQIEKLKLKQISIVNCYEFEKIKNNINNIINNHDKSLNTLGMKAF